MLTSMVVGMFHANDIYVKRDVRDAAFKCLELFITKLRNISETVKIVIRYTGNIYNRGWKKMLRKLNPTKKVLLVGHLAP
jgi:hypothetical protein